MAGAGSGLIWCPFVPLVCLAPPQCPTRRQLLIVFLVAADILGLFLQSDTVSNLRVLRIIRLARLAKLARMLHIGTIFRRWETALRIDYSFLSLFKFMS